MLHNLTHDNIYMLECTLCMYVCMFEHEHICGCTLMSVAFTIFLLSLNNINAIVFIIKIALTTTDVFLLPRNLLVCLPQARSSNIIVCQMPKLLFLPVLQFWHATCNTWIMAIESGAMFYKKFGVSFSFLSHPLSLSLSIFSGCVLHLWGEIEGKSQSGTNHGKCDLSMLIAIQIACTMYVAIYVCMCIYLSLYNCVLSFSVVYFVHFFLFFCFASFVALNYIESFFVL